MNTAISLEIEENESIEERLNGIVANFGIYSKSEYWIYHIDATGDLGNSLTKFMNESNTPFRTTVNELKILFSEDGQVFEFDLRVKGTAAFRLIIRDGNEVNLIGEKEILKTLVKSSYVELDPNLFKEQ